MYANGGVDELMFASLAGFGADKPSSDDVAIVPVPTVLRSGTKVMLPSGAYLRSASYVYAMSEPGAVVLLGDTVAVPRDDQPELLELDADVDVSLLRPITTTTHGTSRTAAAGETFRVSKGTDITIIEQPVVPVDPVDPVDPLVGSSLTDTQRAMNVTWAKRAIAGTIGAGLAATIGVAGTAVLAVTGRRKAAIVVGVGGLVAVLAGVSVAVYSARRIVRSA